MAKVEKLKVSMEIPIGVIERIFNELCIHKNEYTAAFPDNWVGCRGCILSELKWVVGNGEYTEHPIAGMVRDACFSIWHEGILDQ